MSGKILSTVAGIEPKSLLQNQMDLQAFTSALGLAKQSFDWPLYFNRIELSSLFKIEEILGPQQESQKIGMIIVDGVYLEDLANAQILLRKLRAIANTYQCPVLACLDIPYVLQECDEERLVIASLGNALRFVDTVFSFSRVSKQTAAKNVRGTKNKEISILKNTMGPCGRFLISAQGERDANPLLADVVTAS
jgi:hypothetical protein